MGFAIRRIYHPSYRTNDLAGTEDFFRRVFGRYSTPRAGLIMAGILVQPPDYPRDYCTFTPIADVFFDSIDPERYVIDGIQCYPSISQPYLDGFGWGVDGIEEIYREIRRRGIRCTDQKNYIVDSDELPRASFKDSPLFWTLEDDTGIRYEFYPVTSIGKYDPRSAPEWRLPEPIPEDPLGIVRSSHHTVLTTNIDRALGLIVDVLGGRVVRTERNELIGTESHYVLLAGDILEYAVPLDAGSTSGQALARRSPLDLYYSITWQVLDLERVRAHLAACGVRTLVEDDRTILTDPADSIGVPFGFTTELACADVR